MKKDGRNKLAESIARAILKKKLLKENGKERVRINFRTSQNARSMGYHLPIYAVDLKKKYAVEIWDVQTINKFTEYSICIN